MKGQGEPEESLIIQCLQDLLEATETTALCAEARRRIFSSAKKTLSRLPNDNQRHPKILSYIDSDIDAALDVLLSTYMNGVEYYNSTTSDVLNFC